MHHATRLGGQFAHRHAQLFSASLQQHRAGQGTKAAHGRVAHAHRHAAAGNAQAVFHHHIGFAGRGGFDDKGGGVGIQFFADDLRHGGVGALSAFHERAEQAHRAVRANLQERRHLGATFSSGGGLHPARAQGQAKTNHQRAHRRTRQKAATRQVDRCIKQFVEDTHQAPSCLARASTAAWMAL